MPNRLLQSASPYLRQHAENPVDWREWGAEAWEAAKSENKPVFLSVGYSSCHWCHVMAHESFEDPEVAEALNRNFISIKLDREERPDIDDLYMTAVQIATGRGGWPMSVFLTPDAEPFFAGTYFPRHPMEGHPGFLQIIHALAGAWQDEEREIRQKAASFADGLRQVLEKPIPAAGGRIDVGLADSAVVALREEFDDVNGGFGGAPKFPPYASLRFLIRYLEVREGLPGVGYLEAAAFMLLRTLESMALGGIRDHVGGGFHRYSTDAEWRLPHFEKMLTDNGQMLWLYSRAARLVDDQGLKLLFEEVSDGIIDWIQREMRVGGFLATALDADTEGIEGATYTWRIDEVPAVVSEVYEMERDGNFAEEATGERTGQNILFRSTVGSRLYELDDLLSIRNARPQPGRDDKALLSANALAISGLAEAGHTDLARELASRWLGLARNGLPHQWVEGFASHEAFLDGYAYFAEALLDAGMDADPVIDQMVAKFSDNRGFWFTGIGHEQLIGRQKPFLDQAVPSPNGVAIRVLRRAGRNDEALQHLTAAFGWAQRAPASAGTVLTECLEQLALGRASELAQMESPAVAIRLDPPLIPLEEDGWGYARLILDIPLGLHVNSDSPAADWLSPTRIELDGVYGEASFPESPNGRYDGTAEIDLRVKPRGAERQFTVVVFWQLCSETECYAPSQATVKGEIL
ncbi:MAG: thioredoxin domain-containing protein [Armatimonadetes bacterium]|nr:thioredoxin domain-containing protein [Armatimonadota bacterium]MBX3107797.1 thioredoxin domain-containing protein [Fimbriimonadaceae bacterium]